MGWTDERGPVIGPEVDVAVDNDVVLKAACYGLAVRFWPHRDGEPSVGVLGAAPFVLAKAVGRGDRVHDEKAAMDALGDFFARAAVLEPTDDEVTAAAELEHSAQRAGLALDSGESQLAAMVAGRSISMLETGDKRAVRALQGLIGNPVCSVLGGRVRCLEQLFLRLLDIAGDEYPALVSAVCSEPDVDKAASICFGCHSGGEANGGAVQVALGSYVASLRAEAPDVLAV
ncbi:MAG: hypothetical protein M3355_07455 [Actinomycetota bacterium]|nr:hypothetical protein [Actinomycetota bacterium]